MFKTAIQQIQQVLSWLRNEVVKQPLLSFLVIVLMGWLLWTIWATYETDNLGFDKKTLWQWMDLLIVPVVLGLGAFVLTNSQQKNEQDIAQKNRNTDMAIALDRQHQATLEAYFDRMTELLLKENLRNSEEGDEVRSIVRTRTLSVLRDLDTNRVSAVFGFIRDAELENVITLNKANLMGVNWENATLNGANLSGVNLSRANLSGANLIEANLSQSDLSDATLRGINLTGANLNGTIINKADMSEAVLYSTDLSKVLANEANLSNASLVKAKLNGAWLIEAKLINADLRSSELSETNLTQADLSKANLSKANLTQADLSEANLSEAKLLMSDLSGANLSGANLFLANLGDAVLKGTNLSGVIMPDGTKYEE